MGEGGDVGVASRRIFMGSYKGIVCICVCLPVCVSAALCKQCPPSHHHHHLPQTLDRAARCDTSSLALVKMLLQDEERLEEVGRMEEVWGRGGGCGGSTKWWVEIQPPSCPPPPSLGEFCKRELLSVDDKID